MMMTPHPHKQAITVILRQAPTGAQVLMGLRHLIDTSASTTHAPFALMHNAGQWVFPGGPCERAEPTEAARALRAQTTLDHAPQELELLARGEHHCAYVLRAQRLDDVALARVISADMATQRLLRTVRWVPLQRALRHLGYNRDVLQQPWALQQFAWARKYFDEAHIQARMDDPWDIHADAILTLQGLYDEAVAS